MAVCDWSWDLQHHSTDIKEKLVRQKKEKGKKKELGSWSMVGNTNHIQVKYAYRGGWSGEATCSKWLENSILCSFLLGYFDAHALAMDYRSLGFRECLAEVARYLSIIEGLDASDPLRVRLVSHLNNYASQREAASSAHTGIGHIPWGSAFGHHPHISHPLLLAQSGHGNTSTTASSTDPHHQTRIAAPHAETSSLRVPPNGSVGPVLPVVTSTTKLSPPLLSSMASLSAFPFSFGSFHLLSPNVLSPSAPTQSATLGKPYRPWGTEIGAF